jgi:hypothetical protein
VTQCGDLVQISKTWAPHSVSDPLGYYRNNTINSRALIETCSARGYSLFGPKNSLLHRLENFVSNHLILGQFMD